MMVKNAWLKWQRGDEKMIASILLRSNISILLCSAAGLVFVASHDADAQVPRLASTREIAIPLNKGVGRVEAGRDVFRFETFGNEKFWTDAMRMPKGILDAKVTPIQALKVGLMIDIDAIPKDMQEKLAAELKTDMSPQMAPMLNDVMTTVKLIEANAVIGMVPKDSNGDGRIDIASGDKVGVSCALCHTITDKSVYDMPGAGAIGRRVDGPSNLTLNVGKILSLAANSRAFYPFLQTSFGGKTIGRAPKGLTADSTEEEVDAYLTNPDFYPVGMFDDTPDGIGNPVVITPLFRQDLAKPFGSAGEQPTFENFSNGVYTVAFDNTTLATPEGHKFLGAVGGEAGAQLAKDYTRILADTGVTGYPFVQARKAGKPGDPATLVGRRVDEQKLADMKAYTESLVAPKGAEVDAKASAEGRKLFIANCTSCHNVDQSKPVQLKLVDMKTIWPGYKPMVIAKRDPPLDPIQNAPGTFDDKMIVVDASPGGGKRGNAVPMLLDLDRKAAFLHDASVKGLDALLDPGRGSTAPHPFYIAKSDQRADVVAFLRGLDTGR
jgi:cytochrome c2